MDRACSMIREEERIYVIGWKARRKYTTKENKT
jgi:ribosomal protein L36